MGILFNIFINETKTSTFNWNSISTRRQQELAEKLEKVKEVLEDEKKRQFDEPLLI